MSPFGDAVRRLRRLVAFKPRRWSTRRVKVVQRSWEKFKESQSESTTVGLAVFKRFLRRSPAFLQLFPFRDQPLETLFLNAKVRLHCKLFADTVSRTVGLLGDSVAVKASLRELGARHSDLYKVRSGHYVAMGSALLEVLEYNLGEAWDEETKTAWEETWAYITKQMQKGAGSRDVSQRGAGSREVSQRGKK